MTNELSKMTEGPKTGDCANSPLAIPPTELSETNCPVCESDQRKCLYHVQGFPIWKCRECTHIYVSPRPSDAWLTGFYAEYAPRSDLATEVGEPYKVIVNAIERYCSERGVLLDVGMGMGGLLQYLKPYGWVLHGIEPSGPAFARARERLGEDAYLQQASFEDATIKPASLDCVVMVNLIEHVREPLKCCQRAFEILRPGGLFVLRWPQEIPLDQFRRTWLRRYWAPKVSGFSAPLHLHDFTRASMKRLLTSAGFTYVRHLWGGVRRDRARPLRMRAMAFNLRMLWKLVSICTLGKCQISIGSKLTVARKPVSASCSS